jgi:ABC superfamily ATP binding cassette transporter
MRGQTLCLLGPNGVGKTTLFKTILGLLPPLAGEILLSGENMSAWTVQERARRIAYVPQTHTPPFPFTVRDVVLMGRDGVFFVGQTNDTITEERLTKLYGVTAKIVGYEHIPETRTCVPLPPQAHQ